MCVFVYMCACVCVFKMNIHIQFPPLQTSKKSLLGKCVCIESGTTASIALDYSGNGDNKLFNLDKRDSLSLITSIVKYVCLKHGTEKASASNDESP